MKNSKQKALLYLILTFLFSLACGQDGEYVPPERLIPDDLSGENFRFDNLDDQDLSNKNLQGANFGGGLLRGTNFTKANLQDARLTALLDEANFTQADLRGADLTRARLLKTNFTQADLRGTKLAGACYLQTAIWTDAVLDEEAAYLINLLQTVEVSKDLSYKNLDSVCFSQIDLQGVNFRGTSLRGADLGYTDLTGADLTGANLTNANLYGAIVTAEQLQTAQTLCGVHFPDEIQGPLEQIMEAYGPDFCSTE